MHLQWECCSLSASCGIPWTWTRIHQTWDRLSLQLCLKSRCSCSTSVPLAGNEEVRSEVYHDADGLPYLPALLHWRLHLRRKPSIEVCCLTARLSRSAHTKRGSHLHLHLHFLKFPTSGFARSQCTHQPCVASLVLLPFVRSNKLSPLFSAMLFSAFAQHGQAYFKVQEAFR